MYIYLYIYVSVYMYICIYVYLYMCICIYVYMYIWSSSGQLKWKQKIHQALTLVPMESWKSSSAIIQKASTPTTLWSNMAARELSYKSPLNGGPLPCLISRGCVSM